MIGRPRRRHVIDQTGRLRQAPVSPAPVTQTASPSVKDLRNKPKNASATHWLKATAIGLGALLAIFLLWTLISSVLAYNKVTDHTNTKKAPALSFLGNINPNQLQGEGDGRINVLLIGIGGSKHPGGNLADTLMVASFDPKNKEVALLSIPRDLYVQIPGYGYNKINASHSYGEQNAKLTGGGPALTKKVVSQLLDMPIHYYVRLDFSGLEKIVDTLGGVTVTVERPLDDYSYPADNMVDYAPFHLKAGTQTLNGTNALKFARSRHASGAEGSDFARAHRQQLLIQAIKQKAFSTGLLANPKKMNDIIGILGDHVKTDITLTEMERFIELWKGVDTSSIVSKVLDDGPDGVLVSHSGDERGYILLPRTGDYSEIQQAAHTIFADPYLRQEKANIDFINASGSTTTGQQVMKLLTSYGYEVTDRTPKGQVAQKTTQLIDNTQKKPYTIKFLTDRFKAQPTRQKTSTDTDITLILGSDYRTVKAKTAIPTPSVKATASPKLLSSPTPSAAGSDASY